MTRWLCVHLPFFRTERITRASPTTPVKPVALVEQRGDGVVLVAVSKDALAAGVSPGMTAAAARSLLPALGLIEMNPAAEAADFEALAAALGRFTPRVHMDCPGAVLLDITGCERLFGSEHALALEAAATARRLGYSTQHGLADNPTAAYALALGGTDDLRVTPVAALRVESSDLQHFHTLGVRTIGELQALPLESLPSRFSDLLTTRLRELAGEAREDFPAFREPEILCERLDFEGPTDRRDTLLFALRRVAVALEERLAALGTGALALEVSFRAAEGRPVRFEMALTRPTRDSRSLAGLLLGRFEGVDTAERWFDGIEVRIPSHRPIKPPQRDLFGERDPVDEGSFAALVDELVGRLGAEAVVRADLAPDPRPERSYAFRPFGTVPASTAAPEAPRPATIFEPHEVSVTCNEAGLPVEWQNGRSNSRLVSQPAERVHFGWWAGDGAERDYYAVRDEAGACWWLMRRGQGWFIVGAF